MSKIRTYSEMIQFDSLLDRFRYLSLGGVVGETTFGFDRWINQKFYASTEWRRVRRDVIARDLGNDLGVEGHSLGDSKHYVHHMNPMTPGQIIHSDMDIVNPEYLITVSFDTHNAIHYGDEKQLPRPFVERRPGDTLLWKRADW